MSRALTRFDLDMMTIMDCPNEGCKCRVSVKSFEVHSNCDPSIGVRAVYVAGAGILLLNCMKCGGVVLPIDVAP